MRLAFAVLGLALATSGCDNKDDKKGSKDTKGSETPAAPAAGTLGIATLGEAGLSSSLAPEVPASVAATGTGVTPAQAGTIGVALTAAGERSYEACVARNIVRRSYNLINDAAETFCHLEAISDKVKFGVEYTTTDPELGPLSFWIDSGKNDRLDVYLCTADGKLHQKISVTAAAGGRSKGTFTTAVAGADGKNYFEASGRFDGGYTRRGRQRVATEAYFRDEQMKQDIFFQTLLNLNPKGVSVVGGTLTATAEFGEGAQKAPGYLYQSAIARIGQNFGQGYVYEAYELETQEDVYAGETAYNGTFDNAGRVIVRNDVKFFREGGALYVKPNDMPRPLPETFKVPEIDFGWDCVAEEPVDFDASAAALLGCEERFKDLVEEDCDDETKYKKGEQQKMTQDQLAASEDEAFEYSAPEDDQ